MHPMHPWLRLCPKITVWNGRYINRTPKRHNFCGRRRMTYRSSKSVHQCDLCAANETKKDRKKPCSGKQWLFAQTTHVVRSKYRLTWWWWSSGSKFQVSSTSAERLPSCEESKFSWSHYLGQWLIQQPYSRTAVMFLNWFVWLRFDNLYWSLIWFDWRSCPARTAWRVDDGECDGDDKHDENDNNAASNTCSLVASRHAWI